MLILLAALIVGALIFAAGFYACYYTVKGYTPPKMPEIVTPGASNILESYQTWEDDH